MRQLVRLVRRKALVYLIVGVILGSAVSAFAAHQFTDDTVPVFCQTTSDYIPAYNQRAVIHARVSVKPSAEMDYLVYPVWSANGGTVWNLASPAWSVEVRASDTTGHVANATTWFANLTPTLPYRFGLRLQRGSGMVSGSGGTGDISSYFCNVLVEIQNRNGASVPLGNLGSRPDRR